jgi:hypothetical protein
VLNFERHYDPFFRKLAGCPLMSEKPFLAAGDCRPQFGTVSYSDYAKARKAATALFQFPEN